MRESELNKTDAYSADEHRHRFAAWAASRAASVNGCRFKVKEGKQFIEMAGLHSLLPSPSLLPEPESIDTAHRDWRLKLIKAAKPSDTLLTHGVAAKLINVYLKSAFVCGGHHSHERVAALHPPIDSLLLKELRFQDFAGMQKEWRKAERARWSLLSSEEYEDLIASIQSAMPTGTPLWAIEQHWRGFQ